MAATPALTDIVSSLTQEDIPIKLRCASCNKLVLDAYRLPCCDQNICGICQATLPDTCLVCSHSPISSSDCKPNKSLRLTIKAFLKSEEKKREKEKGIAVSVPPTPITPITPQTTSTDPVNNAETRLGTAAAAIVPSAANDLAEAKGDDRSATAKTSLNTLPSDAERDEAETVKEDAEEVGAAIQVRQVNGNASNNQQNWNGAQFGGQYGNGQNHNMQNPMNWQAMNNLNPMMQMQMQHSIPNGNWGFPNMMGMGINPMDMSQGMFGGFGMQNMNGMGGMNGMMSGGMDFNSGYGWNNGQFSGNSFGGNMNGYNQGDQGPYPQFAQNNYQNQNGPRASAASQRTPHNAARSQSNAGLNATEQSDDRSASAQPVAGLSEPPQQPNEAERAPSATDKQDENEDLNAQSIGVGGEAMNDEYVPHRHDARGTHGNNEMDQEQPYTEDAKHSDNNFNHGDQQYPQEQYDSTGYVQNMPGPQNGMNHSMMQNGYYGGNQAYQMSGPGMSFGFQSRGRGRGRGGWRGRGGFNPHYGGEQPMGPPMGQGVEGAPTGPKAMREGFSGRGSFRGRGNGMLLRDQRPDPPAHPTETAKPVDEMYQDEPADKSRSHSADRSVSRSHSLSRRSESKPRSRSRSASKHVQVYDQDAEYRVKSSRDMRQEIESDYGNDGDRHSRASSVRMSSRHRNGRADKERHKSSRLHREFSRERRKRRHRSRSQSSGGDYDNHGRDYSSSKQTSESGRRKSHSERHRDRDDREYDREESHRKDHDHVRGRDRDEDDKGRKHTRRDRSGSRERGDSHKSSRRHRRDRDKARNREDFDDRRRSPRRDADLERSSTRRSSRFDDGDDEVEFKIQGRAKGRQSAQSEIKVFNPPTGPASSRAPPTGPRALLTKISTMNPPSGTPNGRRSQPQTPAASESTNPPPTPPVDPHTLEREARNRERMLKEEQRRSQLNGSSKIERKRSYAEDEYENDAPPSGPRGDRERNKKTRRISYQYEDEENNEGRARRAEHGRDASRWH